MNYLLDVNNSRGTGATWYREHGHLIDHALGPISDDEKFRNLIKQDAYNYKYTYGVNHNIRTWSDVDKAISDDLMSMRRHSAVSDLMGGATNMNIRGVAGHSSEYWEDESSLTSEAFAHMYECQFDKIRNEEMRKYFPKALEYFEEMIKEAAK